MNSFLLLKLITTNQTALALSTGDFSYKAKKCHCLFNRWLGDNWVLATIVKRI